MIYAWLHGKQNIKEDRLSSSIFGLLSYFPTELFWEIIIESCNTNNILPKYCGQIQSIQFWPHWNSVGTNNANFVEPDIFIEFDDFNLIIEVKRDTNIQFKGQWEKEIISYFNNEEYQNKKVVLLAVGGNDTEQNETVTLNEKDIPIIKCHWYKILAVVRRIREHLQNALFLNSNSANLRIINDVIEVFRMNGYLTTEWLCEIPTKYAIVNNSIINDLKFN